MPHGLRYASFSNQYSDFTVTYSFYLFSSLYALVFPYWTWQLNVPSPAVPSKPIPYSHLYCVNMRYSSVCVKSMFDSSTSKFSDDIKEKRESSNCQYAIS